MKRHASVASMQAKRSVMACRITQSHKWRSAEELGPKPTGERTPSASGQRAAPASDVRSEERSSIAYTRDALNFDLVKLTSNFERGFTFSERSHWRTKDKATSICGERASRAVFIHGYCALLLQTLLLCGTLATLAVAKEGNDGDMLMLREREMRGHAN
jgi:hypothetical protein